MLLRYRWLGLVGVFYLFFFLLSIFLFLLTVYYITVMFEVSQDIYFFTYLGSLCPACIGSSVFFQRVHAWKDEQDRKDMRG